MVESSDAFFSELKTCVSPSVTETSITIDDVVHVVDAGRCKSRFTAPASATISVNSVIPPPLSSLPAVDLLRENLH